MRSNTSISSETALLEKRPIAEEHNTPLQPYLRFIRHFRYSIFAVYQRLFTFVFLLNLTGVLILLQSQSWLLRSISNTSTLATFASSNFLLVILFRQDWVINILFRTAWFVPWSLPLRIRRIVSRVYCYGGIHSGAAVMGTLWWLAFTLVMSWEGVSKGLYRPLILILALVIASLLVTIITLSLPRFRARHHDTFEITHRFLGWLSILLFWAQILLLTQYNISSASPGPTLGQALIQTPTFWNLTLMTALLIYPWLRLRRWTFIATPLSSHAVQLTFTNPVHKYSCLTLSSSPLKEWHPFATFPSTTTTTTHSQPTTSIVVSSAGDWTRSLITLTHQKSLRTKDPVTLQFYIKSHPRAGVLSLSCLYARVLILTTGSGIGPSLSSLLDRPASQSARLVWSTRSPLATYGADMMQLVLKADADALILDTDEMGRPDLLEVAWRLWRETGAEAVFVLSNEGVTRWVVGGLERRGVPAFGPIWDS